MSAPYTIEGGINFFAELEKLEENPCSEKNVCLLTGLPLEHNHIVLPCNHTFNYPAIFNEVIAQKTQHTQYGYSYGLDTARLTLGQVKCPYCRHVDNNLLPYTPMPGFNTRIRGVNSPAYLCRQSQSCTWRLRSGKSKGKYCGGCAFTDESGCYCPRHRKTVVLTNGSSKYSSLTVSELKQLLRNQNLKVSGTKRELIDRLCTADSHTD